MSPPRVVALHRPARISGVSATGVQMARLMPPFSAWRPLIIGPDLTEHDIAASALAGAPRLDICTWPRAASPVEQTIRVRDRLRELDADVVVPNDLPHGFAAAALDHHRGLRCAGWLHSASHDGEDLVASCFECGDAWRAVSQAGLDRAAATAAQVGLALPPGNLPAPGFVDVPNSEPAPLPSGPLRLLYAGTLEKHHKRVLDLATLCDCLTAESTAFHLTIAGDGPADAELRRLLASHLTASPPRVTLAGTISPAAMPALVDAHHLLILVSNAEAAPMCIMEAMARGRPVAITRSCGEATQWVRDGVEGFVIATGDMPTLAARVAAASNDRGHLTRLAAAAKARAHSLFSAAARAPALQALIDEARTAPTRLQGRDDIPPQWLRILHALYAIGPAPASDLRALADTWLADIASHGLITRSVALPLATTPRENAAERRLHQAITRLRTPRAQRIALYGAGRHTHRLARLVETCPQIIAIIDDAAGTTNGPPPTLAGKPVLPPAACVSLNLDALILSSDEHEREMLTRAQGLAPRIIPLYSSLDASMPPASVPSS